MSIKLPISKSIANRILLLQAIHGDPLMRVSSDMPDDVVVLHDALQKIRDIYGVPGSFPLGRAGVGSLVLHLKNCGTALRFLEVHLQQCYPGEPITLTGDPRLMERKGKPTSQTNSALLMHGIEVSDDSPYVAMTRKVMEMYKKNSFPSGRDGVGSLLEADWSAAAFWYEYVAIHGGELLLEGLTDKSIQGDRVVADIYEKYFGVQTTFTEKGALIHHTSNIHQTSVSLNFERTPDLYPAVALTCERLGIQLEATGTERLKYKESDRLEAVRLHEVRNDHRMAMALMAADYIRPLPTSPEGKEMQKVIMKSYPQFIEQYRHISSQSRQRHDNDSRPDYENIIPRKGINDDNLGKKHALSKLIHATDAEYVWLHDDDVELPKAAERPNLNEFYDRPLDAQSGEALHPEGKEQSPDLIILPLQMESAHGVGSSLLERLQIAEYAAIQELTIRMAKKGRAVMCSGANLIVKREVWLACESELHPEIPSGDDMFLLEAVKRHGYKIGVIDEPDYTAVVHPQTTWRAFFRQRMRWAGKAPKYTDKDIIRCGALVAVANILQILCPLIILIKFPIEYNLIRKRLTPPFREGSGVGFFFVALLLEIVYPIYLLISLLGGLFSRRAW